MKRKKLIPQGTMVIFFETDLKKATAFDENKLTPLQSQVFFKLSPKEQDQI